MSTTTAGPQESKGWMIILLRGAIAALFGVYILIFPTRTLAVLAQLAAVVFLVEGIVRIVGVLIGRRAGNRIYNLILGILGVVTGLVVLGLPVFGIGLTSFLINFAIIAIGLQSLLSGLQLFFSAGGRKRGNGLYRMGGLAVVIFGLVLLSVPFLGMSPVLARLLGVVALVYGLILVYGGLQLSAS